MCVLRACCAYVLRVRVNVKHVSTPPLCPPLSSSVLLCLLCHSLSSDLQEQSDKALQVTHDLTRPQLRLPVNAVHKSNWHLWKCEGM